jgi:hypothetical protein
MNAAGRGLSRHDMDAAFKAFEALRPETAKRVVKFYELRGKSDKSAALPEASDTTAPAAAPADPNVSLQMAS